ncbi:MAG: NAD+ synthase [Actinobacteria bacterium]|nr:NAD+ synthase [Actinomycetota bacterium]
MNPEKTIRIALAQINTTVGDLPGNRDKIIEKMKKAVSLGCDLVAFPELSISGYPPEDLLLRKQFILDQKQILDEITSRVEDIVCVLGFTDSLDGKLYNSAVVLQNKTVQAVYHKIQLPNYSVFDEDRYFTAGTSPIVVSLNGVKIGLSICEDIWIQDSVTESEAFCGGAELLLNISASPYHTFKVRERWELMTDRARKTKSFIAYCNLVGGQDELVFDGNSLIVSPGGKAVAAGKAFDEDFITFDIDISQVRLWRKEKEFVKSASVFSCPFEKIENVRLADSGKSIKSVLRLVNIPTNMAKEEEIYKALLLGLRDYVHKNGFTKVTFGLSGGVDSALVATLAADALGNKNAIGVTMPSRYSSSGSVDDSVKLARNLQIQLLTLPIEKPFQAYIDLLSASFAGTRPGIAEENLQARIRGNLLMALSNKFGWMVLPTGNKSEVSVGYATIYGDMAGGFAPLKDVQKMMVYALCEYRNNEAGFDLIPRAILEKAPSAELRPDQKDEDSLPPYPLLDRILEYYVEQEMSVHEISEKGFDEKIVKEVARLVDLNEYKRRQAAPGTKITPRAFGKDRRMPITNLYRAQ